MLCQSTRGFPITLPCSPSFTPRRPDQHAESHPDGAVSVPMYRLIDMGQADFAKVGVQGQLWQACVWWGGGGSTQDAHSVVSQQMVWNCQSH